MAFEPIVETFFTQFGSVIGLALVAAVIVLLFASIAIGVTAGWFIDIDYTAGAVLAVAGAVLMFFTGPFWFFPGVIIAFVGVVSMVQEFS